MLNHPAQGNSGYIEGLVTNYSFSVSPTPDANGDSVPDNNDNCILVDNSDQVDTDTDGYGNACDGDFNNDCVVNFIDIAAFSDEFLGTNPLFDLNNDAVVNFLDFSELSELFLQLPGPGQGVCDVTD